MTVTNSPSLAILDAIAFIVSVAAIIDLQKNHVLQRAILIGTLNLFFLFIAFAYTNESTDFGLIWTIFFPIFAIKLMGHKKGMLLSGLFYLILLSIAYYEIGIWNNGEWNIRAFLRLSLASAVLTFIIYAYELILQHADAELLKIHEKEAVYLNELHKLSVTDTLTGLYNRRRMNEVLQEHVANAARYQDFFALILFDIDNFKHINDDFGHNVGDKVLVILTSATKNLLRKTDYFCRWGGEEFLILLPKTGIEEAAEIAEKLRQEIESTTYPHHDKVTCSFGVAQYSETPEIENIINQADNALYQAKTTGKNRVCIYK
jgi:diguanylate cyclase (GGDEF)-like protein